MNCQSMDVAKSLTLAGGGGGAGVSWYFDEVLGNILTNFSTA